MKSLKIFSIILVAFIGAFTFFTVHSESKNNSVAHRLGSIGSIKNSARKDYVSNCARCHALDGSGDTELGRLNDTPDIRDKSWQKARSSKRMASSIKNGRGSMPSFGKKLTAAQINSLVSYIRTLKK